MNFLAWDCCSISTNTWSSFAFDLRSLITGQVFLSLVTAVQSGQSSPEPGKVKQKQLPVPVPSDSTQIRPP